MVQEERVEQVPTQVCRLEAYPETVRIPHVVEKRIPGTYNYVVPRVECYRVPVDECCSSCSSAGCGVPAAAPGFKLLRSSGDERRCDDRARQPFFERRPGARPDRFQAKDPQPIQWREQARVEG